MVIPTRNRIEKLLRCIDSVVKSDYRPFEIIVVDDGSSSDASEAVKTRFPDVAVYRNETRRFLAYSRNRGARASTGDFLFFLDDDNVIAPQTIRELVATFTSEDVAVACPVIYYFAAPTTVWTSYITRGKFPGFYVLGAQELESTAETFSFHDAFVMRRSIFEACGGFDDATFPIHFGELDLAHRIHMKGQRAMVNPRAKVWHDVGEARMHVDAQRSFYTLRNRVILLKRYGSPRELREYIAFVLPLLTAYYLVHHTTTVREKRLRSAVNLLRGVVAGLASNQKRVTQVGPRTLSTAATPSMAGKGRGELPLVSVIVPTRNSARTLWRTLDSLEGQTYPNIEIIVVDNFSKDATISAAEAYPRVRVYRAGPERSAQVNYGVKMAHGKYIYRVDSDFVVGRKVIEEAVAACETRGYKVVAVHNTSDASISFWSAVRKLERDCYRDDTWNIAARFFDADVFRTAGGFDETLIASEDYDLHNRLVESGYGIGRIQSEEVHIGEPKSLKAVVATHVFYGRVIRDFMRLHPGYSAKQLSPVRLSYVRHWRDFLKNPKRTAGFFVYQYVRYSAALAGYLSSLF